MSSNFLHAERNDENSSFENESCSSSLTLLADKSSLNFCEQKHALAKAERSFSGEEFTHF